MFSILQQSNESIGILASGVLQECCPDLVPHTENLRESGFRPAIKGHFLSCFVLASCSNSHYTCAIRPQLQQLCTAAEV